MVKMQCDGITKDGQQCQRWVTYNGWNIGADGGLYCHRHRYSSLNEKAEYSAVNLTYSPVNVTSKFDDTSVLKDLLDTMLSIAIVIVGIVLGLFMLGVFLYIMEITGLSDNDFLYILILGVIGYISLSIALSS